MCLGVPMRVRSCDHAGSALCAPGGAGAKIRQVDTLLLDSPPRAGDWLLVHVGVAIRALPEEEAQQISDALLAVSAAAAGEPFEHLLADLIEREPQLPLHLREPDTREVENG